MEGSTYGENGHMLEIVTRLLELRENKRFRSAIRFTYPTYSTDGLEKFSIQKTRQPYQR